MQDDTKSESSILDDLPATDDNCNDSMINLDFKEVYNIYQKDKSDNLMCQLELIRENKHEKYISDREKVQDASNVCPSIETEITDNGRTAFTAVLSSMPGSIIH